MQKYQTSFLPWSVRMLNISNHFGLKATFFCCSLKFIQPWRGYSRIFRYSSSLKSSFCGVEVGWPQNNLVLFSHNVTLKTVQLCLFGRENGVYKSVLAWTGCYTGHSNRSFDYCSLCDDTSAIIVNVSWISNHPQNLHFFGFSCRWI